ncbi:hypothetical protein [Streptomyces sp. NPDC088762]|uniref:hypothetical protein n=1 Tax=Streptomyces sp. NPDC088762 TaxID=3365891 RepID=UPI003812E31C
MRFEVGDMAITTVGTDGDDRTIEFLVTPPGAADEGRFAIHREHGQGWETARLTIDPESGGIPVAAVEWAVEFAREYL